MSGKIDPLAIHPELIATLAEWHDREWRHLNPDSYDIQARIEDYRRAMDPDQIPVMLVAHDNGKPMGSVQLINDDMETHPELSPWLASLYVHPEYRQQGIATRLILEIEETARQLGFDQLYLFTEDRDSFYKKLGWRELFREIYYGESVTVMQKHL
jgi:GNAT superfamily N-acetyltransferase